MAANYGVVAPERRHVMQTSARTDQAMGRNVLAYWLPNDKLYDRVVPNTSHLLLQQLISGPTARAPHNFHSLSHPNLPCTHLLDDHNTCPLLLLPYAPARTNSTLRNSGKTADVIHTCKGVSAA
jgi:hypothetical protein